MSRSYICDGPDCGIVMDDPAIAVQYTAVEDVDDDEPSDEEVHLCSWVCLSAWSTAVALDYQPL